MPSSRQVRMIRSSISPRLAISTRRNGGATRRAVVGEEPASTASLRKDAAPPPLERDVAMLLPGVRVALVGQHLQRANQARPGLRRLDDVVDITARGGDVRVREFGFVG